jgi:serine/threonine protein kinase
LHEKEVVHLDIKPDNILLQSDDGDSVDSSLIALVDFGASRLFT